MSIYFARILPVEAFGQLAFLISVSAIAQTLAEFNLPNFIVYNQSYLSIKRYVIMSSILYMFITFISIFLFDAIYQYWWFVLIFGILNMIVNYLRAIYYIKSWLIQFNMRYIISVVLSSLICLVVGLYYHKLSLILTYNLLSLLIVVLTSIKKIELPKLHLDDSLWLTEDEKKYVKGFYLANLFNIAASNAENIVLKSIVGASSLGFYNRAKSVEAIATNSALQSMSYVFFAKLNKFKSEASILGSNKYYIISFISFIFIGAVSGIFIYFIGPLIVSKIYGDSYVYSGQIVKLLAYIIPSQFLFTWLNMVLSVEGRGSFFAKINVIKTLIFSLLLFTLIYIDLSQYLVYYSIVFIALTTIYLSFYYFMYYARN